MPTINQVIPYIILWAVLLGVFLWFVVRPKRVALAQHKDLIGNLERGDLIITAGGVHGRIVGLQQETVTVEIAPGVEITLERRAVRRTRGKEGP